LYYWVIEKCGIRKVFIEDYSRLNFSYTVLSKRKLQKIVDMKRVTGWNDPSFPTIQGVMRRGLTVEALRAFVISQGASKATNLMDMDKLWAVNRKVLDPIVGRYTAVSSATTTIRFSNVDKTEVKPAPLHKKNASLGEKMISYGPEILIDRADANLIADGEEITLMDWGNCICKTLHRNDAGEVITIDADLHLAGNFKTTSKKLTWLDAKADNVPLIVKEYETLITKPKLEDGDEFESFIAPQIEFRTELTGDMNLRLLPKGTHIQLERKGYYICDKSFIREGDAIELVRIPEGKKKSMGGAAQVGTKPSSRKA